MTVFEPLRINKLSLSLLVVATVINNTGLNCEGLKCGETAGNETEAKVGSLDSEAKLAHWSTAHHAQGAAETWWEKVWQVPWCTKPMGIADTPLMSLDAQRSHGENDKYAPLGDEP